MAVATTCLRAEPSLTCVPVTGVSPLPSGAPGARACLCPSRLAAPPGGRHTAHWPYRGGQGGREVQPPAPSPCWQTWRWGFTHSRCHTWGSHQDPAGPLSWLGGVQSWVRGRSCMCTGVPRSACPPSALLGEGGSANGHSCPSSAVGGGDKAVEIGSGNGNRLETENAVGMQEARGTQSMDTR